MASDIKITVQDRCGRKCASSGSKWEPILGYSRAVRSGNTIAVTGCVGVNADGSYPPSVEAQAWPLRRAVPMPRGRLREAMPRPARRCWQGP